MVSKENVIQTNSSCVCGNNDEETSQKNYYENKCPNCGKEGTLQVESLDNVEVDSDYNDDESTEESSPSENQKTKIVCTNCGSEYCGYDGYDMAGGTRSMLSSVNPNEITDEEEEVSSTEEEETTYMSGWEGLCDLIKPLDGQAMILQRGDYVIVKKIEMPQKVGLWAYEGINVVDDSVTVTDYTPEIFNTFIIKWGESFENELEFVFKLHKQRFGERKVVMEAKKYAVVEDESDENTDEENNEENSNEDESDETTDSNEEEDEDSEIPDTEEVPITDRDEAIQFGLTQVGKAKRDDGHTIELKVIGNQHWMMGEWCHVRLPSFGEDCYMFISKCGFESSPDDEYINSLTLVDYPPSLGKLTKPTEEENIEEEETESDENTDSNEEGTENDEENNDSS